MFGASLYVKSDKESVLGSSLNIKYGTSIPKLKRSSGKIQMYGANGIIDFIDEYNTKDANIIFGCRGKVGDVYFSNKEIFVLNTAFYLNVPPNRLGDYYFSIKNISGFADYATGAAQPQITLTEIKNIYIDISNNPSLNFVINMIIKLEDQNILLNNQKSMLLSKFF